MHDPKEIAGRRAALFVEGGMVVGLGTGSTVHHALAALGERVRAGLSIRAVPTSIDTERKARALGIPLITLDDVAAIDLTIDGADEIDPRFDMIKGGGGALLREKVVASISRCEVIVVGAPKRVQKLGAAFPLPVEVVPFARRAVAGALERLGARVSLRQRAGEPSVTDNGNWIIDCAFERGIDDARELERAIAAIPGAVESGLFIGLAHVLVVGHEDGRCELVYGGSLHHRS